MKPFLTALFFLTVTFFHPAICQSNFQPGYILKTSNDTVKGFIDYRNWDKNPETFNFKSEMASHATVLTPMDVLGFYVENEAYSSAIVMTDAYKPRATEIESTPEIILKKDTVFLRALATGSKSLYYLKNDLGREHFYITQENGFDLLFYKRYKKLVEDKDLFFENNRYKGQLTLYLSACDEIPNKLKNIRYAKESLINLFSYYYRCVNENTERATEKTKTTRKDKGDNLAIGVIAGLSQTTLTFSGDIYPHLTAADFKNSQNIAGGIFFEYQIPRSLQKWAIYNDLMYTSFKTSGDARPDMLSTVHTSFDFAYLKLNTMLRYSYRIDSYRLFANVGVSNGIAIKSDNIRIEDHDLHGVETTAAVSDVRTYEQGLLLGIGLKKKQFGIEGRWEKGNGFLTYTQVSSSVNRLSLLLRYQF